MTLGVFDRKVGLTPLADTGCNGAALAGLGMEWPLNAVADLGTAHWL